MSDAFTTTDINGRDEETSMYIALLERQVVGLTIANLRQKAALDGEETPDNEPLIEESLRRLGEQRKASEKMNRRSRI